jgi:hypothetical protein
MWNWLSVLPGRILCEQSPWWVWTFPFRHPSTSQAMLSSTNACLITARVSVTIFLDYCRTLQPAQTAAPVPKIMGIGSIFTSQAQELHIPCSTVSDLSFEEILIKFNVHNFYVISRNKLYILTTLSLYLQFIIVLRYFKVLDSYGGES